MGKPTLLSQHFSGLRRLPFPHGYDSHQPDANGQLPPCIGAGWVTQFFIPVDEGTSLSSSAKGLAGRYAGALYALAEESGKIDAVVKDMNGVAELVSANQDMLTLVESPAITWAEQTKAVTAVLEKGGADALTVKFVGTVASNGRLHALSRIISAFLAEHARRRGEVSAEVISAVEMDDARQARVEQAVSKLAGSDKLSLSIRVDPSLIGGLVVRIGSRMIDTSIRTKLNRLETAMKGMA